MLGNTDNAPGPQRQNRAPAPQGKSAAPAYLPNPICHSTTAPAMAALRDSHCSAMGIFTVLALASSTAWETPRPSLPMATAQRRRSISRRSTVSSRRAVA